LTVFERLKVGAECETLFDRARHQPIHAEIKELREALKEEHAAAKKIPVERRKDLTDEKRELMTFDMDAALASHLGIEGEERPPRLFQFIAKRPKGLREKIIKEVATTHGLTRTMVNNCWKEYRRCEREPDC
jgi:hypothetical protein